MGISHQRGSAVPRSAILRGPGLPALLLASIAIAWVGCGGGRDPAKEQQRTTLNACGFPTPCGKGYLTYTMEGARTCMLGVLASGEPAHLSVVLTPDGGGDCHADWEIYLLGNGSALWWSRGDGDCSEDPNAVNYKYYLNRCELKDKSVFQECLDGGGGTGGSGVSTSSSSSSGGYYDPMDDSLCYGMDWFVDCSPGEPACQ